MIRDMSDPAARGNLAHARPGGAPGAPRTHAATLVGLPEVLSRFGIPWEPVLEAEGLTLAAIQDPERSVSFSAMDRISGECYRLTRCPHVGLLLAQRVNLQSFGIAGRLARNAPSVGDALQELAAHFALHDTGGLISFELHPGKVTLSYGLYITGLRNIDQIYDFCVVAMCNILRQLCGADWKADVVQLPRRRPADVRPYREILGAPLRFDSVQAGAQFPQDWLSRPVVDADPFLHALLVDRARAALRVQDPLLCDDVRRTIRLLLMADQCSREAVARRLGMHPRTLGRRLQQCGTTFQDLLDETRLEVARQLLRGTRSSVARIASSLGYHDPTVFTRAFRRWTGTTPRDYRAGSAGIP
jgi:AraC-like DNA-binding protein